jgi:4,5-dihydroxyphthalate decarboxylase
MLAEQELDAALVGSIAQASAGNRALSSLRPLFPDVVAEGRRFYAEHGYVPANHTSIINGDLARRHPALAANLYHAFRQAKSVAQSSLPPDVPSGLLFGSESLARSCESIAGDPFAYGIEPNRTMLETVVRLSHEQGLIRDRPTVEQLFAPGID